MIKSSPNTLIFFFNLFILQISENRLFEETSSLQNQSVLLAVMHRGVSYLSHQGPFPPEYVTNIFFCSVLITRSSRSMNPSHFPPRQETFIEFLHSVVKFRHVTDFLFVHVPVQQPSVGILLVTLQVTPQKTRHGYVYMLFKKCETVHV